jgi:hypothetical protein
MLSRKNHLCTTELNNKPLWPRINQAHLKSRELRESMIDFHQTEFQKKGLKLSPPIVLLKVTESNQRDIQRLLVVLLLQISTLQSSCHSFTFPSNADSLFTNPYTTQSTGKLQTSFELISSRYYENMLTSLMRRSCYGQHGLYILHIITDAYIH